MFPSRNVNELVIEQIVAHMESTFNPTTFVRERYKFWTNCRRNPGETILELATRIRQAHAISLALEILLMKHSELVSYAMLKMKQYPKRYSEYQKMNRVLQKLLELLVKMKV